MAEVDFFFGEPDQDAIVALLLSLDTWLVPDLEYRTSRHATVRSFKDYRQARTRGARLFHVLSEAYLRCPLEMRYQERKKTYYVMQRNGGPAIDLCCSETLGRGRRRRITQGFLGRYPTYWNTLSQANERPPAALVKTYDTLVKHIKRSSARVRQGPRVYWVGPHAQELRTAGAMLVGVD